MSRASDEIHSPLLGEAKAIMRDFNFRGRFTESKKSLKNTLGKILDPYTGDARTVIASLVPGYESAEPVLLYGKDVGREQFVARKLDEIRKKGNAIANDFKDEHLNPDTIGMALTVNGMLLNGGTESLKILKMAAAQQPNDTTLSLPEKRFLQLARDVVSSFEGQGGVSIPKQIREIYSRMKSKLEKKEPEMQPVAQNPHEPGTSITR
jgi:hypothetical protein